ncbi:hypothetical protein BS47DRAFT_1373523 [Hydnum rufescens UP504]|uniref:Uncharacterized protein n=1 Tax=Hydnum rufescens UP504 TaxID=1448309 RepID=A0A9P6AP34_9AGAM|nr:hypothetical protein BS47DRAFT_1373523 [Hydnum rufescens UP504]
MASVPTLDLDWLFAAPSRFPPSPLCPSTLAGHTDDSVQTLRTLLKLNIQNHHIFVNELGFHNHLPHHLFAKFALGANSNLLRAIYEHDKAMLLPAIPSPGLITPENYISHLGVSKTLEEYIYSRKANYDDQLGNNQPEMFSRFIGSLYHPLIHLGYGLEFGVVGVVAGGTSRTITHQAIGTALAEMAVHESHTSPLIPVSSWDDDNHPGEISSLGSRMTSHSLGYTAPGLNDVSPAPSSRTEEISLFNILAMIQRDDTMTIQAVGITEINRTSYYEVVEKLQEPLLKEALFRIRSLLILADLSCTVYRYANMWTLNIGRGTAGDREVERKIEEFAFAVTLMYGVGRWSPNEERPFWADFFLMHLITSSLFFPAIVAYFPPHAIQLLFRTYLCTILALWITEQKPVLHIKEFMKSTTISPQDPNAALKLSHKPVKGTLTPETVTPNPWLAIVPSVLEHSDEHFCKIMRSLMHWANLFGSRPAGYWAGGKEELEGIEALDGTLFLRVAGLTMGELGWAKEGQDMGGWVRSLPPPRVHGIRPGIER